MSMYYSEPLTQESLVRLLRSFDAQAEDATELCYKAADRIEVLETALREIANHWVPSVNSWAMKFKEIASHVLEGK